MSVLVKIHQAYREIVAVCDKDLLGKKFEQGDRQLEVNERFFGGEEMQDDKIIELLKEKAEDDACFNFVGKKAVELGAKADIIDEKRVLKIQKVPIAMSLF